MTAADILDTLAPLLAGIPVAGPWIAAGLGLASRAARAGLSPEHITRIDLAALGARRAEADARLDALVPRNPVVLVVRDVDPASAPRTVTAFEYPDDPEPGEQGPGTVLP